MQREHKHTEMLLLVILEVYTHLCWRQMLFWKHCSPTCQLSFIYNHQPGNTPINGLCLPGLWWLSKTCIKLLFLTAGADDCVILFFFTQMKEWITAVRLKLATRWEILIPHQQFKNIHGLWSLREAELLQGWVPAGCLMLFYSCSLNYFFLFEQRMDAIFFV